jgi:hypothetical protein
MKKNFHKRSTANISAGGMHIDKGTDASALLDACPVYLPGSKSKGSCAKSSFDPYKNSQHLIRVMVASRQQRQFKQAEADAPKVTWQFELADIATKNPVRPPKRSEMDEGAAAAKNKSIKELGLYWRRAPY